MPKGVYERTPEMKLGKHPNSHLPQCGFQKGHKPIHGFKKGNTIGPRFKKGEPSPRKGKKYPQFSGKNNWNWKGGITINSRGYIYILKSNHPFCNKQGYIKRANLVIEKMLGRYIIPPELVHHKGIKYPFGSIKNKQDDQPKNLQLFANGGEHTSFHNYHREYKSSNS